MGPPDTSDIISFQGYTLPWSKTGQRSHTTVAGAIWFWQLAVLLPPLRMLICLRACPMNEAMFVRVKLASRQRRLVGVERLRSTPDLSDEAVRTPWLPLLLIRLFGCRYSYDQTSASFIKAPRMPAGIVQQIQSAVLALTSVDQGGSWEQFNAPGSWPRRVRQAMYGPNLVPMAHFTFARFLLAELLSPLFLFQGRVHAMNSQQLVPGDVIVVQAGQAVCDMVLLQGNALTEESRLTGQGRNMRKVAYTPQHYPGVKYDPNLQRSCTIFAGSFIQQVWNDTSEQEECLAMVVRTGLNSAIGEHLSLLLYGRHNSRRVLSPEVKDVLQFMGLSFLSTAIMLLVTIPAMLHRQLPLIYYYFGLLNLLLNFALPILPALLVIRRVICILRLRQKQIFVSDSLKVTAAARLDMVLFDKTGTLTVAQGKLQGVFVCERDELIGMKTTAIQWGSDMRLALALCSDLTPLHRNTLAGHPDEKKVFQSIEAAYLDRNHVRLPLRSRSGGQSTMVTMQVLRRFEFEPQFLLMSGVIAMEDNAGGNAEPQVLLKGAPQELIPLLGGRDKLPKSCYEHVIGWTGRGFRVLVFVGGKVNAASRQDLSKISLLNLKQHTHDIRLLGLAVYNNTLRADSASVIAELQDRAHMRTMMVTGDHIWTAASVSYASGIVKERVPLVIIDKTDPPPSFAPRQIGTEEITNTRQHFVPTSSSEPAWQSLLALDDAKLASAEPQVEHSARSQGRVRFETSLARSRQPVAIQAEPSGVLEQPQPLHTGDPLQKTAPLSLPQTPFSQPEGGHASLKCLLAGVTNPAKVLSYTEALQLIAEGTVCAVTGSAFDHLLQLSEPAVMQSVLQSLVLAARMQSHQKAQLVKMLSCQGLLLPSKQHFKGVGHVVGFCGDGFNDIPAIYATDIGIAVGASEAALTAPVFTSDASAKVVCSVIMEARCGLLVANAFFRFMVLYGFLLSLLTNMLFFQTSSAALTISQYQVTDFGGMAICLAMAFTATCTHLRPSKLQHRLMSWPFLGSTCAFAACATLTQAVVVPIMRSLEWFNGEESQVAYLGIAYTVTVSQILCSAICSVGYIYPDCKGSFKRMAVLPTLIVVSMLVFLFKILKPTLLGEDILVMSVCPFEFRLALSGVLLLQFVLTAVVQLVVIRRKCAQAQR
ncbi:hypothetical protein ABBQ38_012035 [Trebouxia sp. C0009 RCD-2024]